MSYSRDVSNIYTVAAIRKMALMTIEKGMPADAPEDGFYANFTVDDGEIILTTGVSEEVKVVAATDTPSRSELKRFNKGELIDLILS